MSRFIWENLPLLDHNEHQYYKYRSVPVSPPIPKDYLLHYYNYSDHSFESTKCLEQFPKRKTKRLESSQTGDIILGWGIHFTERFYRAMIVTIILIFFLFVGLVFAILWGVFKYNVSAAFTVASFISLIGALTLAAWAVWAVII